MKWIILLLRAVMSHTPLKAGHCFGVTTLGLYNGACSACSFGLSDKSDWERELSYHSGKMPCTAGEGEMGKLRNNTLPWVIPAAHSG